MPPPSVAPVASGGSIRWLGAALSDAATSPRGLPSPRGVRSPHGVSDDGRGHAEVGSSASLGRGRVPSSARSAGSREEGTSSTRLVTEEDLRKEREKWYGMCLHEVRNLEASAFERIKQVEEASKGLISELRDRLRDELTRAAQQAAEAEISTHAAALAELRRDLGAQRDLQAQVSASASQIGALRAVVESEGARRATEAAELRREFAGRPDIAPQLDSLQKRVDADAARQTAESADLRRDVAAVQWVGDQHASLVAEVSALRREVAAAQSQRQLHDSRAAEAGDAAASSLRKEVDQAHAQHQAALADLRSDLSAERERREAQELNMEHLKKVLVESEGRSAASAVSAAQASAVQAAASAVQDLRERCAADVRGQVQDAVAMFEAGQSTLRTGLMQQVERMHGEIAAQRKEVEGHVKDLKRVEAAIWESTTSMRGRLEAVEESPDERIPETEERLSPRRPHDAGPALEAAHQQSAALAEEVARLKAALDRLRGEKDQLALGLSTQARLGGELQRIGGDLGSRVGKLESLHLGPRMMSLEAEGKKNSIVLTTFMEAWASGRAKSGALQTIEADMRLALQAGKESSVGLDQLGVPLDQLGAAPSVMRPSLTPSDASETASLNLRGVACTPPIPQSGKSTACTSPRCLDRHFCHDDAEEPGRTGGGDQARVPTPRGRLALSPTLKNRLEGLISAVQGTWSRSVGSSRETQPAVECDDQAGGARALEDTVVHFDRDPSAALQQAPLAHTVVASSAVSSPLRGRPGVAATGAAQGQEAEPRAPAAAASPLGATQVLETTVSTLPASPQREPAVAGRTCPADGLTLSAKPLGVSDAIARAGGAEPVPLVAWQHGAEQDATAESLRRCADTPQSAPWGLIGAVEPEDREDALCPKAPSKASRVDNLPPPPAQPPPRTTLLDGSGDAENSGGVGPWGLRVSTSSDPKATTRATTAPETPGGTRATRMRVTRNTWRPTSIGGLSTRSVSTSRRPAAPLQRSRALKSAFYDAKMLEETAKEVAWRGEYDVADLYHTEGHAQWIARHPYFGAAQMLVVFLNAIWIGVETDYNDKEVLYEADWGFQFVENLFCIFFLWEWLVRLCAFRIKVNCIRDFWFTFDTALLVLMVLETWVLFVVSAVTSGDSSGLPTNLLRLVKLARLTRSVRIARLLRSIPELTVIIRGIMVVMRTVFLICILMTTLLYVFGILFVQVARDSELNDDGSFRDVPTAMASLVLGGLIPDMAPMTHDFARENILFAVMFFMFVLLGFITIMNMLIGVLVQVVGVVANVEAETNQLADVKKVLLENKYHLDVDGDITMQQIKHLLGDPAVAEGLQILSIDPEVLLNHAMIVFGDRKNITMHDFWQMAVQHRGANTAKVQDLVNMRQFIYSELASLHVKVSQQLSAAGAVSYQDLKRQPSAPVVSVQPSSLL